MELAPWAEAAGARSGEEEWVEMERGGAVPICPSLSVHRGTRVEPRVGQLVVCWTGRLIGWQADWNDCLGGWWGSLVCHFCYDFHGCQWGQGSSWAGGRSKPDSTRLFYLSQGQVTNWDCLPCSDVKKYKSHRVCWLFFFFFCKIQQTPAQ